MSNAIKILPWKAVFLLLLMTSSVFASNFEHLAPGTVVTATSLNSCSDCSASSRYVVSGYHSSYTTTLNLTSHDAFNIRLSTVYKYSSSGNDFITVYHYFGDPLPRNFPSGGYTFLAVNYSVSSLESMYDNPEKDISGVANSQRLSNIEEQLSDSGTFPAVASFFVGSLSAVAFVLAAKK